MPDIDWKVESINNYQYPKQLNERFIELTDNCSMEQVVIFPKRKQNTFDLLITNRPSFINKCIPVPGFGDHNSAILFDLICHSQATKPIKRIIHNWKRANLEELRKNVKEQMVKFVRGNTINTPINQSSMAAIYSTIRQLQKKLFQAEYHHLVTVNLGVIKNAKTMLQGKSVFITKQEE